MNNNLPQESDFLLHTTPQGDDRIQVLIIDDSDWLTQEENEIVENS